VSSRSSAIDLGKNSGVDLGSKTQTSVTTGGIGVTQEVGNIGGVTVTGGVSVDISPIGLSISGRSDYEDPSKSTISIAGGAEIPGGILGVSGGFTVNTSTGQIEGGSIGGEIIGIGVGISKSSEGVGVEISLQIPFTPIEISLGFEFPEDRGKTPTPLPSPSPAAGGDDKGFGTDPSTWPTFKPNCHYIILMLVLSNERKHEDCLGYGSGDGSFGYSFKRAYKIDSYSHIITGIRHIPGVGYRPVVSSKTILGSVFSRQFGWIYIVEGNLLPASQSTHGGAGVAIGETITATGGYGATSVSGQGNSNWATKFQERLDFFNNGRNDYTSYKFVPLELCPGGTLRTPIYNIIPLPSPSPSPSPSPPFPNPPPRKRNMDQCCRESTAMLRDLMKVLQVREVLGGKMEIPGELLQIPIEDKPLLPEKLKTYPQMVNALLMAIDRHGIDAPITVEIEDSDKTKAGNQEVSYTYNSPGVALQAALELLHEIKADANARLSIQIGLAFAVTRILKIVAGSGETLRQIILMLGLPFRYKPKKLQLEFNLSGTKQGFGENTKEKDVADLSKEELEQIIPTLLSGSEIDVPVPTFNPEDDDLREMLAKISIVQSSKKG